MKTVIYCFVETKFFELLKYIFQKNDKMQVFKILPILFISFIRYFLLTFDSSSIHHCRGKGWVLSTIRVQRSLYCKLTSSCFNLHKFNLMLSVHISVYLYIQIYEKKYFFSSSITEVEQCPSHLQRCCHFRPQNQCNSAPSAQGDEDQYKWIRITEENNIFL